MHLRLHVELDCCSFGLVAAVSTANKCRSFPVSTVYYTTTDTNMSKTHYLSTDPRHTHFRDVYGVGDADGDTSILGATLPGATGVHAAGYARPLPRPAPLEVGALCIPPITEVEAEVTRSPRFCCSKTSLSSPPASPPALVASLPLPMSTSYRDWLVLVLVHIKCYCRNTGALPTPLSVARQAAPSAK